MNLPKDFSEINSVTGFCIKNAVKKIKQNWSWVVSKLKQKVSPSGKASKLNNPDVSISGVTTLSICWNHHWSSTR